MQDREDSTGDTNPVTVSTPSVTSDTTDPMANRFSGLGRIYGREEAAVIAQMRICVVGIGGVGSWSVEALARSGVGHLTLIDPDDVTEGNINRQLHALDSTIGQPKVEVMRARVSGINPQCHCDCVEDYLVEKNLEALLDRQFDYVIDAIDSIRFKAAMINFCRRRKVKIITTGGAGGRSDPTQVSIADLSLTWNDALAAKVRKRLRTDFGYSTNPQRRFGVECVYSSEQPRFPRPDGSVTHAKPGIKGVDLDCEHGYGSASHVTGVFGLFAASRAINKALSRRMKSRQ